MVAPVAAGAAGGGAAAGGGTAAGGGASGAGAGAAGGFDFESIFKMIQGAESGSEEAADFSGFDFPDLISQILAPAPLQKAGTEFGKIQGAASDRQSLLGTLAMLKVLDSFGSIFEGTDPKVVEAILAPQVTRKNLPPEKEKSSLKSATKTDIFAGKR